MSIYQRPLVYKWECEYHDGTHISQFDDLKPRKATEINQKPVKRFVLKPFTLKEERELNKVGIQVKSIPFIPSFSISLSPEKRVIYYRQVFISQEEYHYCNACKKEFYYSMNSPKIGGKYPSPICPHCGSHDYFYCKNCNKKFIFEETKHGLCPICNGGLERKIVTSKQYSRERRWIEYYIGYQYTKDNRNVKFIMKVLENGDCEILGN